MIQDVILVTGNENKRLEFEAFLPFSLQSVALDLDELQTTDLETLLSHKSQQAFDELQQPVLVEDTALYFNAWNELPGPFIKWFLQNLKPEGLYQALEPFDDKTAYGVCGIGYRDQGTFHYWVGRVSGQIVPPRGTQGFGWDALFVPEGSSKTFGEMTLEEKATYSMRKKALHVFSSHQ